MPSHASPTPLSGRALAPDLARGMMLLLIALAHAPWFLYTSPVGVSPMHPADGNLADHLAQALTIVMVDGRTHTMFGLLFAYGIGQMYARQTARGTAPGEVRGILRRRHAWMLIFGLVHAALLWQGDILGTYGLIGLLMMPLFFRRSDRTLGVWILVLLVLGGAIMLISTAGTLLLPPGDDGGLAAQLQRASLAEPNYLAALLTRIPQWLFGLLSGVGTLALPTVFLVGILAARHRILEEPERHLTLLRWTAAVGIGVGWTVGLAQAFVHLGILELPNPSMLGAPHFYSGIFAGVGYAALFGLLAHRLRTRGIPESLPVRALSALGRRSLSGYLAQSVIYGPLLAAWGLGLGTHLSSWSAMLLAVAVWLLTIGAALALDRNGQRGPAEVLLRRLTYRQSP
ncbi:DUF418 domain-containing protein [Citricoccus sp. I39-566]|uniref:DUF418 domain-containing protein n=1 Tax=Citricoccus sp. I39-566 TaxID=3073268 RepID=UPI00286C6C2D|nr:DUF418 domain-containing protein [Citricoccus sp. I39-566]WMY78335.1 DUF418 domain-containing protein [Citricoccus sp. I39-566]